jgi:hypothetical protein
MREREIAKERAMYNESEKGVLSLMIDSSTFLF